MSGRSDPTDARPSAVQAALLDAVAMPGVSLVRTNFPWPATARRDGGEEGEDVPPGVASAVPLWRASVRNAAQYAASRRHAWAERHRPGFEAQIKRAPRTALLCGSCGLELLANLSLAPATLARVHVFAWGPVARRLPPVASLELVQGRTDRLSRWWVARSRVHHVVESGHMGYLDDAHVRQLARRFVAAVRDGRADPRPTPCA